MDTFGNNLLAEFGGVVDVIECAVKIPNELKIRNSDLPENDNIEFHELYSKGGHMQNYRQNTGQTINLIRLLLITALSLNLAFTSGCFDKRNTQEIQYQKLETYIGTKYPQKIDTQSYLTELKLIQERLRPGFARREDSPKRQQGPKPLPGRLIVNIASSELAELFKPIPTAVDKRLLIEHNLWPDKIKLQGIGVLGPLRHRTVYG